MKTRVLVALLAAGAVLALVLVFRGGGSPDRSGLGTRAHAHTAAILEFGPRPAGSAALDRVRTYLVEELAAHGWVARRQEFDRFTPEGRIEFANIVARFAPRGSPPEAAWSRPVRGLLSAHIDSKLFKDRKFLGADDAASAAGLILAIAADLAAKPRMAEQLEIVFFDGEEAFGPGLTTTDGIYGSRHYAAEWVRRTEKPAFGIVLDMVGHRNLRIAYPSDSPQHLVDSLLEAAASEGATRHFRRAAAPIIDDHVPLNNAGIPTIDIIGDFMNSGWWHTPRDNLALISADSLDLTGRVVLRMLAGLLE